MGDLKDIHVSYARFLNDRTLFRENASQDPFETPGHSFFKIMFHFYNGDSDGMLINHGGLLAPTWLEGPTDDNLYQYDSAWAYLKNNYEDERADKLEKFVNLLSTISCDYPWYFQEITGLDAAMDRQQVLDFKVAEERKKLQIKCLQDSHDEKITTLLSLYRSIVWSWHMKREVVPANLRKFDMSVFIWESPIYALHAGGVLDESAAAIPDIKSEDELKNRPFTTTYKLLEFHNCEIDYNSIKLNNKEGMSNEYTIDISYDDCYEHMFNQQLGRTIGDLIAWDAKLTKIDDAGSSTIEYEWNKDANENLASILYDRLKNRMDVSSNRQNEWYLRKSYDDLEQQDGWVTVKNEVTGKDEKVAKIKKLRNCGILPEHKGSANVGFFANVLGSAVAAGVDELKTVAGRLFLGNIYGFSISNMASQLNKILSGDINAAIDAVDQYANTDIKGAIHNNSLNNLAAKGQKFLNALVNQKENEAAAGKPYKNNAFDRSEVQSTLSRDLFDPATGREYIKESPSALDNKGIFGNNSDRKMFEPESTINGDLFDPSRNRGYESQLNPTTASNIYQGDPHNEILVERNIYPEAPEGPDHVNRDIYPEAPEGRAHLNRDIYPTKYFERPHIKRDIYETLPPPSQIKTMGNLNKAKTLINNI